jgi:hypothetical protein
MIYSLSAEIKGRKEFTTTKYWKTPVFQCRNLSRKFGDRKSKRERESPALRGHVYWARSGE